MAITLIKLHRKIARISLRALEDKTRISKSRLQRMENGLDRISAIEIEMLQCAIPTLKNEERIVDDEGIAVSAE